MKKGMRERVSGDDVCDCCFGEQLDNKKPFRPLYIFKHMLKNNFVLLCFASFLNYDLFQVNIVSDPSCRCGANREDSYHCCTLN
jgi:hypothetical protein